jgi:hypothetical protein
MCPPGAADGLVGRYCDTHAEVLVEPLLGDYRETPLYMGQHGAFHDPRPAGLARAPPASFPVLGAGRSDCRPVWALAHSINQLVWDAQNIHSFIGFDTPDGAIGHPAHEYEVAVRSATGEHVKPGETARLWIRGIPGLSLFLEYLNNPEATDAAFDSNGWFNTGDEVRLDTV